MAPRIFTAVLVLAVVSFVLLIADSGAAETHVDCDKVMHELVNGESARLRHAAALALFGWYLLAPPGTMPNIDVPVSDWLEIGSYGTASECKTAQEESTAKF